MFCFLKTKNQKYKQHFSASNRRETTESKYQLSRWTPYIKDIMEVCLLKNNSCDEHHYYASLPSGRVGG